MVDTLAREDFIIDFITALKDDGYVIHNKEYPDVNYLDEVDLTRREKPDVVKIGFGSPLTEEKQLQNAINKTPMPLGDNFEKQREDFEKYRMSNRYESTKIKLSEKKLEDINPIYAERIRKEKELIEKQQRIAASLKDSNVGPAGMVSEEDLKNMQKVVKKSNTNPDAKANVGVPKPVEKKISNKPPLSTKPVIKKYGKKQKNDPSKVNANKILFHN